MAQLTRAPFRPGERIRYVGETNTVEAEGNRPLLLARGLIGHVLEGPRSDAYQIAFGGAAVWVRSDRLEPE
jgi:hypothetical protein